MGRGAGAQVEDCRGVRVQSACGSQLTLIALVRSTEKGDIICYYGNRGNDKPVVLEPGEPPLVGATAGLLL